MSDVNRMTLHQWVEANLPANAEYNGTDCVTFFHKGIAVAKVRDIYGIRFEPEPYVWYVRDESWSVLAQAMEFAKQMDNACGVYGGN